MSSKGCQDDSTSVSTTFGGPNEAPSRCLPKRFAQACLIFGCVFSLCVLHIDGLDRSRELVVASVKRLSHFPTEHSSPSGNPVDLKYERRTERSILLGNNVAPSFDAVEQRNNTYENASDFHSASRHGMTNMNTSTTNSLMNNDSYFTSGLARSTLSKTPSTNSRAPIPVHLSNHTNTNHTGLALSNKGNTKLQSSAVSKNPKKTTSRVHSANITACPTIAPNLTKHETRYVTFAEKFADGRQLGNQMFNLASMLYLSKLSGRTPVMERVDKLHTIEQVFDLSTIVKLTDICPCYTFSEQSALMYDRKMEEVGQSGHESASSRTILLGGFYQSWKYVRPIEHQLRRYLKFHPNMTGFAENFLIRNSPPGWKPGYVKVAIHVRRGDIFQKHLAEFGYTAPDAKYFERAMTYFIRSYDRVQFIAMSSDVEWTKDNIKSNGFGMNKEVNVTYAFGNTYGQDMAIMAKCDHVIMSTGTFGWWGAFLAKGTTIYYSDWPRKGSELYKQFKREDFFLPAWIPM